MRLINIGNGFDKTALDILKRKKNLRLKDANIFYPNELTKQ